MAAREKTFVPLDGRPEFFVRTTAHPCMTAARWDDKRFSRKTILMVLDT
jgi:hypothetical protein